MAAAVGRCGGRRVVQHFLTPRRCLNTGCSKKRSVFWPAVGGVAAGAIVSWYVVNKAGRSPAISLSPQVHAKAPKQAPASTDSPPERPSIQAAREMRFLRFASIEYEGSVYMTPQDFLESITEEVPRPRTSRYKVKWDEVKKFLAKTPTQAKSSSTFFRNLRNKGMISYTEYLFLLCVLSKPRSGFDIAFNMFDMDGNQKMDKKEFLVMERILLNVEIVEIYPSMFTGNEMKRTARVSSTDGRHNIWNLLKQDSPDDGTPSVVDTTLTVHFFGQQGKDVLKFENFRRFMENLQTEVLELEFKEFSRGMPTITEEEFARILLRYTIFSVDDQEKHLERLRHRILDSKGISFEEFKKFGLFLNSLEDFAIAMKMYSYANHPVSQDVFNRAVKACTGHSLDRSLVNVVFQLFDNDGDGHLSHGEFISVMKNRLHRGFRSQKMHSSKWGSFKSCVTNEMRT